jgi:feruloyl esterase
MGAAKTDSFTRLYLMPGVGHCGGGDGYTQFDLLSPLMAWVEKGQAPKELVAGKVPPEPRGGRGGPPGGAAVTSPLAQPDRTPLATRPVYPFPMIAKFNGKSDPNDAANYSAVRSPIAGPQAIDWAGKDFIAPNNQKNYGVANGRLVVLK